MTGYGRAESAYGRQTITVEIKSVNSRYLDSAVRAGSLYIFLEEPVKAAISAAVTRGKVSAFISVDTSQADDVEIVVNEAVADGYLKAAKQLTKRFAGHDGLHNDLSVSRLMTMHDVLTVKRPEQDADALQTAVLDAVNAALAQLNAMRRKEGGHLRDDLLARCGAIAALVGQLKENSPKTVEAYRAKITERMQELLGAELFDPQRVIAEAALFADRIAIDEELTRLDSHVKQLKSMLSKSGAVGRKLDFLMQEFNREANTVGSKANDTVMAQLVVDLKAEIEKMREQVQNIE